ncbi:MAG: hypothetical protein EOP07_05770 [Proteobacteria bacterium]|nr:MAG: hypothetical protein EOP07_05770 [Pseudomonadota bacterium]
MKKIIRSFLCLGLAIAGCSDSPGQDESSAAPQAAGSETDNANTDSDGVVKTPVIDPVTNTPITIPLTNAVVYGPIGKKAGGYQKIASAVWPNTCTKGDIKATSGALFPFNENQTLVIRGPIAISDMIIYEKKTAALTWTKLADQSNLNWFESNYGAIKNLGPYIADKKLLENGREVYAPLPASGELILVMKTLMPMANTPVYSGVSQDDVPAIWMLNSEIFKAPSSQYFCNCRGLGNPGGCGELDIAEIIPGNKTEVTTTIYSYEGARGSVLKAPRPSSKYQIYAVVLRSIKGAGEVSVLELDSFDFSKAEFSDSFLDQQWLPTAKRLNAGSEKLNAP